jgi:hypothetical protein
MHRNTTAPAASSGRPQRFERRAVANVAIVFKAHEDTYSCTREDLICLGKKADGTIKDDLKALEYGSELFKVDLDGLRNALRDNAWARANILNKGVGSAALEAVGKVNVGHSKMVAGP